MSPGGASPTQRRYEVISADGHLEVPPDGWLSYVPREYQDRAPRLRALPEGGEAWLVEGSPLIHNGTNLAGGRTPLLIGESYWRADGTPTPGTGGAAQRLREQDEDSIDAEVLFPPVFSRYIENIGHREVYRALVTSYNEFVASEYCAIAPDRLVAMAMIPITGIDDAVSELRRAKDLGFKGVCLNHFPNGTLELDPADDLFWETSQDLEVSITIHISLTSSSHPAIREAAMGQMKAISTLMRGVTPAPALNIAQLLLGGVFGRHPALRIYFAETNVGWLPEVLYRMDESYQLFNNRVAGISLRRAPSEVVREHLLFGIVKDPIVADLSEILPIHAIMWGSDFPHTVTSFPESARFLNVAFGTMERRDFRRIVCDNAIEFFRLNASATLTPTPAHP